MRTKLLVIRMSGEFLTKNYFCIYFQHVDTIVDEGFGAGVRELDVLDH